MLHGTCSRSAAFTVSPLPRLQFAFGHHKMALYTMHPLWDLDLNALYPGRIHSGSQVFP